MKWVLKEMKPADMVRVPSGSFYHYGICVDEDTIIQFGESVVNPLVNPDEVEVNQTDIGDFLRGRFAEVAEYDKKELKRKKSPEQIIAYAKGCIGKKGYHILYNNCEHFANECVFGDHKSTQTEDFRDAFCKKLPVIDVYVADVARFKDFKNLPRLAKQEIKVLKNDDLIEQKRCAYGLLEYAVKGTFNKPLDVKSISKDKRGKPHMREGFFSISHTKGLACIAVSRQDVGVDIELLKEHIALEPLKTRITCDNETAESTLQTLSLWTKKEAIYKLDNNIEKFIPSKINTNDYQTKTVKISFQNNEFLLSVASQSVDNVNFLLLDGKIIDN